VPAQVGIWVAKIAEYVSASANQFKIVLVHRRVSFSRLIRSLNPIDVHLWHLDSALRLLLKRVNHPYIVADLDGIDRAKGVTPILQRDLEHTAIHALERLVGA
jgi:hypothetical protein